MNVFKAFPVSCLQKGRSRWRPQRRVRPSFSTFSAVVGITWGLLGPGNHLLPLQLSWWEELLLLSCLSGSLTGRGFRRRIAPSFTPRPSEQVVLSCGGDGEAMDCNRTTAVLSWGPGGWLGWGSRAGSPRRDSQPGALSRCRALAFGQDGAGDAHSLSGLA